MKRMSKYKVNAVHFCMVKARDFRSIFQEYLEGLTEKQLDALMHDLKDGTSPIL